MHHMLLLYGSARHYFRSEWPFIILIYLDLLGWGCLVLIV